MHGRVRVRLHRSARGPQGGKEADIDIDIDIYTVYRTDKSIFTHHIYRFSRRLHLQGQVVQRRPVTKRGNVVKKVFCRVQNTSRQHLRRRAPPS